MKTTNYWRKNGEKPAQTASSMVGIEENQALLKPDSADVMM